ncbi:hypothetical protein LCGC14_0101400 [marine sediment metagenome]|uniref:Uncharacterized protein n=1 Tax=marine sediment metagenome TaxID=412755 RepID=A0A0F9VBY7_9ZZZZ
MNKELNPLALGYAAAIISALIMLLLGILGNLGMYTGAVEMMQQWHIFFSLSIGGIIAGIIEAAVISFILIYKFGWLYNKLTGKLGKTE